MPDSPLIHLQAAAEAITDAQEALAINCPAHAEAYIRHALASLADAAHSISYHPQTTNHKPQSQ